MSSPTSRSEPELKTALLSTLLETSPDATLLVDENARVVLYSPQFPELFGIPPALAEAGDDERLLQVAVSRVKDPDAFLAKVRYLYGHREERSRDELHFHDGRIIDRHSTPVVAKDGSYLGRVWYFHDVTEQRRAEEALRESHALLTTTERIAAVGGFGWDVVHDVLEWSDEVYRMFGRTRGSQAPTMAEFVAAIREEDRVGVRAAIGAALLGREPFDVEFRIVRSDGSERTIHSRAEVTRDRNGKPLRMVGISHDVTERRRTERALEESERRWRAILEATVDGIVVVHAKTRRITLGNRSACEMFGYRSEELLSLSVADLHPPEALPRVLAAFERQAAGEGRLAANIPVRRKDGSILFADISAQPVELDGDTCVVGIFHDVTERRRAEEAVARSETSLAEAQRITHVGSWEWDIASNEIHWSKEMCRIFGLTAPPETYEAFLRALYPDDSERIAKDMESSLHTFPRESEYRVVRPNGEMRTVRVRAEVEFDADGRALRAMGTMQDVTEQKRAEVEIHRLASHPRLNPNPIVDVAASGALLYANRAAERQFPDLAAQGAHHPLLTGLLELFETLRHKPGAVRDVAVGERVYEEHLSFVAEDELVRVYAFDVTEQRRTSARLHEMAEIYQLILDSRNFSFVVGSPDLTIRAVNEGHCQMLGYTREELVGRKSSDFIDLDELRRWAAARGLPPPNPPEKLFPYLLTRDSEMTYIRKDGSRLPMLSSLVALRDPAGRTVAYARIGQDLTMQKALDRMKTEFISTVSHELRTPLTSIRGALGLLEGGIAGPLAPEAMNLVQLGRTNTDRLIRLINDILDLDRLEGTHTTIDARALLPTEELESTFALLQPLAAQSGIVFEADVRTHAQVLADKDRFDQVLVNLLSNAIKFSPRDTVVRVVVTEEGSGRVRLSVVDQGPGIPTHLQPLLFRKFQQLDASDSRSRGGSGLGLAISRAVVERLGGSIGVASEVGHGSTFWFELPTAIGARPVEPMAATDATPLLVVEDDLDFSRILQRLFANDHYAVRRAGTLAEAKRLLETFRPAAVLLDVGLPDGSGLDLIEWLRARDELRDVPVVVITGTDLEPGRFGPPVVIDWLHKPVDEERLVATVRRAVGAEPTLVLVVDDDVAMRRALAEGLASNDLRVVEAGTSAEAIELARARRPDLVVLDVAMPWPATPDVAEALVIDGRMTPLLVYSARDRAGAPTSIDEVTRHLTTAQVATREFLDAVRLLLNRIRARVLEKGRVESKQF